MALKKYIVTKEDRNVAGATYSAYRLKPVGADRNEKSFLALVPKDSAAHQALEDPVSRGISTLFISLTKGEPTYIVEAMAPWKYEHGITIQEGGEGKLLTGDETLTGLSMEHMRWSIMDEQFKELVSLRSNPQQRERFNSFADEFVAEQLATDIQTSSEQAELKLQDVDSAIVKKLPRGFPVELMPALTASVLKRAQTSDGVTYNFTALQGCFGRFYEAAKESGSQVELVNMTQDLKVLGMSESEATSYVDIYRQLPLDRKQEMAAVFRFDVNTLQEVARLNQLRSAVHSLRPSGHASVSGSVGAGETLLMSQLLCKNHARVLELGKLQDPPTDDQLKKLHVLAASVPDGLLREADITGKGDFTRQPVGTDGKETTLVLTKEGVATLAHAVRCYDPTIGRGLADMDDAEFSGVVAGRAAELKATENQGRNLSTILAAHQANKFDQRATVDDVLGQDRALDLPQSLPFALDKPYTWVQGEGTKNADGTPASVNAKITFENRHYILDASGLLRRMIGPAGSLTTANGRVLTQQENGTVLLSHNGATALYPDLDSVAEKLGDDTFRGPDQRDYVVKGGKMFEAGSQRYNLMADSALDTAGLKKHLSASMGVLGAANPVVDFYRQKALQVELASRTQQVAATSHEALTTGESAWTHWNPKKPSLTMCDENLFYKQGDKWVPKRDFLNLNAGMTKYIANQVMGQVSAHAFDKTTAEGPALNAEFGKRLVVGMGEGGGIESCVKVASELTESGLEQCAEKVDARDFTLFREHGALKKQRAMAIGSHVATAATLTMIAAGYGFARMAKEMEH